MAKRRTRKRSPKTNWTGSIEARVVALGLTLPRLQYLLQALAIVLASLWIYWPALHGDWLWDDNWYVIDNPLLHDPARLWKAWCAPGSFVEYYPIEETVQWLQWQLWHNDTFGYHVTNVLLHIISAFLVWRLLSKFGLRLAWLGGLLFAIHPVQVESVAWIVELKNTLSLPPFLLAMIFWIDYEQHGRAKDYFCALSLFLIAMLCKISMAPFPVVILLYAWWKRDRIGWNDFKASLPFFVISFVLGVMTVLSGRWYEELRHLPPEEVFVEGPLARVACAGLSLAFYFSKAVLPVGLITIYPKWAVNPPTPLQFLPWLVLVGVVYYLWTKRQNWGRHALLGLGFFLLFLAPFLGFTLISYMHFTWVMVHYLYIPIIGLIGVAIAGVEQADELVSKSAHLFGIGVAVAVMTVLAWGSHEYAKLYVNSESLWTYTIQHNLGAWTARSNLGIALAQADRLSEAMEQFKQALKIEPDNADVNYNLGLALARTGHLSEAMERFDQVVRIYPEYPSVYLPRGKIKLMVGDLAGAKADFDRAIQLAPQSAEPYFKRGLLRQIQGDFEGALSDLREGCELAPNDVLADYARLSIWLLNVLQHDKIGGDHELAAWLSQDRNTAARDWVSQVARFLLDQVKEEDFLTRAQLSLPPNQEQICEAWYFAGIKHLAVGDQATATVDFRKCVATGQKSTVQYLLAQAQLKVLSP